MSDIVGMGFKRDTTWDKTSSTMVFNVVMIWNHDKWDIMDIYIYMTRNDDKNGFTIKIVIWAIKTMGKYVYIYIYTYDVCIYIVVYLYGIWLDWPTTWYARVSKNWGIAELMVDYQIWRYSKYPIFQTNQYCVSKMTIFQEKHM